LFGGYYHKFKKLNPLNMALKI